MFAGSRNKHFKPSMNELMTRSLDPALLDSCTSHVQTNDDSLLTQSMHCPPLMTQSVHCPPIPAPLPLPAASQLVPVPESLVSPSVTTVPLVPKLQTIKCRAQEKRDKKVDHGKNLSPAKSTPLHAPLIAPSVVNILLHEKKVYKRKPSNCMYSKHNSYHSFNLPRKLWLMEKAQTSHTHVV